MPDLNRKHIVIFIAILLVSLVFYILTINFNYTGYYNDDAWYINSARYMSGVQSKYKELTERPIGYPILLMPFTKLFPENILIYRMTSTFFILFMSILLFRFFKDIIRPGRLLVLTAMVNLNAATVILSGDVMSEASYIFFTFIILVLFKEYLAKKTVQLQHLFLLSIPLSFLFYIRHHGFLMFIAIAAFFLLYRRFRELIFLVFIYLILIFPILYKVNTAAINPISRYLIEMNSTYTQSTLPGLAIKNALFYLKNGIFTGLLNLDISLFGNNISADILIFSISILFCTVMIYGFLKDRRTKYSFPIRIYLILYLLTNILWINVSLRYIFPILPFMLYFFIQGLYKLKKGAFFSIAGLILFSYIQSDIRIISDTHKRKTGGPSRPFKTFEWIKNNTNEDSVLWGNFPDRFFLNTNRIMIYESYISHQDIFYFGLLKNKINYVVPLSTKHIHPNFQYQTHEEIIKTVKIYLSDTNRFRKIYTNSTEDTSIWEINQSTTFIKAFTKYASGLTDHKNKKYMNAKNNFLMAIKLSNHFPSAHIQLALLYLQENDHKEALKILEKSIQLSPGHIQAQILNAQIYESQKQNNLALYHYNKALEIAVSRNNISQTEKLTIHIQKLK